MLTRPRRRPGPRRGDRARRGRLRPAHRASRPAWTASTARPSARRTSPRSTRRTRRAPTRGAWTLVLDRGRFAITQDGGDQGCAWAYGALGLGERNVMSWTVIDAGAVPAAVASNQPGDRYRFGWSRYRDVLTLSEARGGAAGYFAAKPWRRIAQTPTASGLSARCPPPAGALQPTGAEHATPSRDAAIHFTGDLVRTTPQDVGGQRDGQRARPRPADASTATSAFSRDQTRRRTDLRGPLLQRRATRVRDHHDHAPSPRPLPLGGPRADHRHLPGPARLSRPPGEHRRHHDDRRRVPHARRAEIAGTSSSAHRPRRPATSADPVGRWGSLPAIVGRACPAADALQLVGILRRFRWGALRSRVVRVGHAVGHRRAI